MWSRNHSQPTRRRDPLRSENARSVLKPVKRALALLSSARIAFSTFKHLHDVRMESPTPFSDGVDRLATCVRRRERSKRDNYNLSVNANSAPTPCNEVRRKLRSTVNKRVCCTWSHVARDRGSSLHYVYHRSTDHRFHWQPDRFSLNLVGNALPMNDFKRAQTFGPGVYI